MGLINKYPAILDYLESYKSQLMPKPNYFKGNSNWCGRKSGSYEWYEIQDNIAYWQEFNKPKIVSTKVSIKPTFALDLSGSLLGNTAYFITLKSNDFFLVALLNSSVSAFYAKKVFVEKQNGWYEVQPDGLEVFPIPRTDVRQEKLINFSSNAFLAVGSSQFEALINGLVYELFFPEDLHQANIHLFDAVANAGLDRLADLDGTVLADAANELATLIFAPHHPIQGMLADLQKLEVVRIIEGRD